MRLTESVHKRPTGTLCIQVWRDGACVGELGSNRVVDLADSIVPRALGGAPDWTISKFGIGENGLATAPGDTSLTNAFIKAIDGVSYPTATSVVFAFSLEKEEAVGLSIREFGLLTGNETLFARKVRSGDALVKDDQLSITGTWTIQY